jgi:hypothetical protein
VRHMTTANEKDDEQQCVACPCPLTRKKRKMMNTKSSKPSAILFFMRICSCLSLPLFRVCIVAKTRFRRQQHQYFFVDFFFCSALFLVLVEKARLLNFSLLDLLLPSVHLLCNFFISFSLLPSPKL